MVGVASTDGRTLGAIAWGVDNGLVFTLGFSFG